MGPELAGVSGNKGRPQSRFVPGTLPLGWQLLSCRFPVDLQLLSGVWVRGEVDLADPSHETGCYQGQQRRTASGQRQKRFLCQGVSYLRTLTAFNSQLVGSANTQRKDQLLTPGPSDRTVSAALSSSPERGAVLAGGTSAYLVVTDGHRGMQKVPDLSQVLKPLFLQLYPLSVTLQDGFVNEEAEFLDL